MHVNKSRMLATAVAALLAITGVAACGGDDDNGSSSSSSNTSTAASGGGGKTGKIAFLLPESKTARYETQDRPLFEAKVKELCSGCEIVYSNADQDASKQQQQAEAALTQGVKVMVLDPVDGAAAATIVNQANQKGVPVISYDRLLLNSKPDYYVEFNSPSVGEAQGKALSDKLGGKGTIIMINGAPTDNNAKLFAQGYNKVLDPMFQNGTYVKVGEPAGTWTPSIAQTTFAQQYTAHPDMNSVVTPNDDNANAVIAYLQSKQIKPKTFPTTGQDAGKSGLQNILKGYQCGTVYKNFFVEAQAAAALALYLRAGQTPPSGLVNATTADSKTGKDVKSSYLTPTWVTTENMASTVIKDGYAKASDVCVAETQSACTAAGIS